MTTCNVVETYRNFGETWVNFDKTTRRQIPQDGNLHSHLCQNLTYNSEQEKRTIPLLPRTWKLYVRSILGKYVLVGLAKTLTNFVGSYAEGLWCCSLSLLTTWKFMPLVTVTVNNTEVYGVVHCHC
jgi:hypothetical protein